ncbi:MAG: hypothetical protein H6935_12705 [Thiobacillus sp.]|nr:hypothetical protein [Thiobacillus sp.]
MEITVYRDQAILREVRQLPADTYNLARTLQARGPSGVAFVPIRSMQVLAILDRDEFIFLDSQYKTWAMVAWQCFRSDEREALDEPVSYELACYEESGLETMKRLPREFHLALQALASKGRIDGPARVLKFEARRPG